jgi:hypothetical protein
MGTSGISVQDLEKKDLERDHRIKHRIEPDHAAITTSFLDIHGVKFFRPILLEVFDDLRNTSHVSLRYVR